MSSCATYIEILNDFMTRALALPEETCDWDIEPLLAEYRKILRDHRKTCAICQEREARLNHVS